MSKETVHSSLKTRSEEVGTRTVRSSGQTIRFSKKAFCESLTSVVMLKVIIAKSFRKDCCDKEWLFIRYEKDTLIVQSAPPVAMGVGCMRRNELRGSHFFP